MDAHAVSPTTPNRPSQPTASRPINVTRLERLGVQLAHEVMGLHDAAERCDLDEEERGDRVLALAREILSEDIPWVPESGARP